MTTIANTIPAHVSSQYPTLLLGLSLLPWDDEDEDEVFSAEEVETKRMEKFVNGEVEVEAVESRMPSQSRRAEVEGLNEVLGWWTLVEDPNRDRNEGETVRLVVATPRRNIVDDDKEAPVNGTIDDAPTMGWNTIRRFEERNRMPLETNISSIERIRNGGNGNVTLLKPKKLLQK